MKSTLRREGGRSSSSGRLLLGDVGEGYRAHGTFGELQKQTCFDGIRLVSRLHPNGSLVEFSRNFVGTWKSIVFVRVFSEKKQLTPEGGIVFSHGN